MLLLIGISLLFILLGNRIKNPIYVIIMAIFSLLLYSSKTIWNFFPELLSSMNITVFLYNHRLLLLFSILLIHLHVVLYRQIGINEKVNRYLERPASMVRNLMSVVLSIFGDFITINHPLQVNKNFLQNRKVFSTFCVGSYMFMVSYFVLSQFYSMSYTFFIILVGNITMVMFFILALFRAIFTPVEKVNYVEQEPHYITSVNITKLLVINLIIIVATCGLLAFFKVTPIMTFFVGLLVSYIVSLFYIDNKLHKTNTVDERNLFNATLNQVRKWTEQAILLLAIVVFVNLAINNISNYWQIAYSELLLYMGIVNITLWLLSLFIKNYLYLLLILSILIYPILQLQFNTESIVYISSLYSTFILIYFFRYSGAFSNKTRNSTITAVMFILINILANYIMVRRDNLSYGYGVSITLMLIFLVVAKGINAYEKSRLARKK